MSARDGTVEEHSAPVVVLNTGVRPRRPELEGLDSVGALDSSSILTAAEFPSRLLILGGGYIALELGQVFRRLGAEVTVVEMGSRLAAREDEEISRGLEEILRDEGIALHLGARAMRTARTSAGVRLELDGGKVLEGTHLLVAVGRTPNSDALDCPAGGVALDSHGFSLAEPMFGPAAREQCRRHAPQPRPCRDSLPPLSASKAWSRRLSSALAPKSRCHPDAIPWHPSRW